MIDTAFFITSFVTLFVIIDPIGLTPLFVALTQGWGGASPLFYRIRAKNSSGEVWSDAGMISSRDLGRERVASAMAEAELAVEKSRWADAQGALAAALGLPLETVRSLNIADDPLDDPGAVPDAVSNGVESSTTRSRENIRPL